MKLNIRQARESDLPACAEIMITEFSKQGEPWTTDSAKTRLADEIMGAPELCFCLEFDEKLIGFMFCEKFNYVKGKYLWVAEFAISSEYQSKGHGLKALQFIEKYAKEKSFDVLYLATNIKEKAFKIYEKFGFRKTNWFFMEKEL